MNTSMLRSGLLALALSTVTGVVVNACASPNLVETSGEKAEWSVLQSIELNERENHLTEPVIRTVFGSEVLGVPALGGGNVWILLNVQSPPYYKQIPHENYTIPSALLAQLEKERRVSYTVVAVLRAHARKQ